MTDLRQAAKLALKVLENKCDPDHEAIAALKRALAEDAMDRMSENARELGLNYEPRDEAFKNFAKAVREYADEQRALADDISQQRVDKAEEQRHEPVAWFSKLPGNLLSIKISGKPTEGDWQPLYTRPQQCPNCASLMEQNTELDKKLAEWVGLTEEELYEIFDAADDGQSPCGVCGACGKCSREVAIAEAVEAKLKEKNRG